MKQQTLADRYGLDLPADHANNVAAIELSLAFRKELFAAEGWLGRYQHWHNAVDAIWNIPRRMYNQSVGKKHDPRKHDPYIWNDWSEQTQEAFCESHWSTVITSGNSSWKTTGGGLYGLGGWYARPKDTIVVMTTTTLAGLRRRLWKETIRYHSCSVFASVGHVHATDYAIRWKKGSDEAGIFGVATGQTEGEVKKAIDKIIGFHAPYVIVLLDEAQATNEAILKACISLEAGAESFQLIILGNIDNELSPMGQAAEPVDGWDSVNKDTGRWETKRGICIHLNGLNSPRIIEGEEFYPGLLTARDVESAKKEYGEDSPWFWQFRIGFPPPQGITRTVLSAPMIRKGQAMEDYIFSYEFKKGLALDPSYEGEDRCVVQIWKCGTLDTGICAMALTRTVLLKIEASSDEPIHYQIVRKVKEIADEEGIELAMVALDSTGEGGGVASIIKREWGYGFLEVEFGGKASEDRVSDVNPKKANQLYDRKITELYFRFQTNVIRGQVRGLDRATANEFCLRQYADRGYGIVAVETKADMKKRTNGRSCDLSDTSVIAAGLFRKRGLLTSPVDVVKEKSENSWLELAKEWNDVDSEYVSV